MSSGSADTPQAQCSDEDALFCPECDYNLTGAPGARCPWCGWRIDPRRLGFDISSGLTVRRLFAILTGVFCGVGSLVVAWSLAARGQVLAVNDWVAICGVGIAAAGHLVLAGLSSRPGSRWPMHRRDGASLLLWAVILSVLCGIVGAVPMLTDAPARRVVRDVQVNGPFEFVLSVTLYSLPAILLMVLRVVSYREAADRKNLWTGDGAGASDLETDDGGVAPFEADLVGPIDEPKLSVTFRDEPQRMDPSFRRHIAQTWEAESALAETTERRLFNGKLVRLVRIERHGDVISLHTGPTDYRDFLGTNLYGAPAMRKRRADLSNALGVSVVVRTADDMIAVGRRSERVAFHRGCIHPFGGMVDRRDVAESDEPGETVGDAAGGVVDLRSSALREVREELGLAEAEIEPESVVFLGLARDREIQQPEAIFGARITLSRRQLEERFRSGSHDNEHSRIIFVRDEPDSVAHVALVAEHVTPVCAAALLLHGRARYGPIWYDQTCVVGYGEIPGTTLR